MNKTLAFVKKELLEMLPPTIFFFIVFELVVFMRHLMGSGIDVSMTTTASAAIGALIVGKSVLIADALPMFRWFSEQRLIYNILWRVVLYLSIILIFQVLEETLPRMDTAGGFTAALAEFGAKADWSLFWATHVFLAIFLVLYSIITALIDLIGEARLIDVLFGRTSR